MSLTVESAREALGKVQDPALNRDLVKHRFVSSVEVQGGDVLVTLDIPTHGYPQAARAELVSRVEKGLKAAGASRVTVMVS